MMNMAELRALKEELDTDPMGAGYADMRNGEVATAMNDRGHKILSDTCDRSYVSPAAIKAVISFEDWDSLINNEQTWLEWLTKGDKKLPVTPEIKLALTNRDTTGGVWPSSAETAPSQLKELIEFQGSRAECLWGEGTLVNSSDVSRANRLTG